jgi:hypothetical protein
MLDSLTSEAAIAGKRLDAIRMTDYLEWRFSMAGGIWLVPVRAAQGVRSLLQL